MLDHLWRRVVTGQSLEGSRRDIVPRLESNHRRRRYKRAYDSASIGGSNDLDEMAVTVMVMIAVVVMVAVVNGFAG